MARSSWSTLTRYQPLSPSCPLLAPRRLGYRHRILLLAPVRHLLLQPRPLPPSQASSGSSSLLPSPLSFSAWQPAPAASPLLLLHKDSIAKDRPTFVSLPANLQLHYTVHFSDMNVAFRPSQMPSGTTSLMATRMSQASFHRQC